jgi:hypothetical protein
VDRLVDAASLTELVGKTGVDPALKSSLIKAQAKIQAQHEEVLAKSQERREARRKEIQQLRKEGKLPPFKQLKPKGGVEKKKGEKKGQKKAGGEDGKKVKKEKVKKEKEGKKEKEAVVAVASGSASKKEMAAVAAGGDEKTPKRSKQQEQAPKAMPATAPVKQEAKESGLAGSKRPAAATEHKKKKPKK